jgi:protein-S-isoprenylcysteine O-methyltransferase Ste14
VNRTRGGQREEVPEGALRKTRPEDFPAKNETDLCIASARRNVSDQQNLFRASSRIGNVSYYNQTLMTGRKKVTWFALAFGDVTLYAALLVFGVIWRRDALALVGAFIAIIGFTLVIIARLQLGDSFTGRAEARALVTSGLYSRIRHPVYFFGVLALCGIAICLRSICFNVYLLITILGLLWRIRRENKVLREKFGMAYADHRRQTWF